LAQPTDRFYTKEHEWVKIDGASGVIGITEHAQSALGDIVYVELPKVGASLEQGKPIGVIESVKAVSDIYAPVSGTVTEVNSSVVDDPAKVNGSEARMASFRRIRNEIRNRLKSFIAEHAGLRYAMHG